MREIQQPTTCLQKIVYQYPKALSWIEKTSLVAQVALSVFTLTGHIASTYLALGFLGIGLISFSCFAIQLNGREISVNRQIRYGLLTAAALMSSLLPIMVITGALNPRTYAAFTLSNVFVMTGLYSIHKGLEKRRAV